MIVRIKGVKPVRSKGKVYYYHRRTMTRLPGQPGTTAFMDALKRLDTRGEKAATLPGTLGGLIAAYRASPEFARLAPNSQRIYNGVLDILALNAARPLVTITTQNLYELRDQLAAARGRSTVNMVLTVLRVVFGWGIKRGQFKSANPVVGVDSLRRPRDAKRVNRPWSDVELAAVLDASRGQLRLALTIAAYTGLRESDVVSVPWSAYDGRAFLTVARKTGQRVWIPAHPRLRAMLDARLPTGDMMLRDGADDAPIVPKLTASAFRSAFFRLSATLRSEGKVGEGLSIHGLRHTLGHALAEAGCDPPTIGAILGHSTGRMAEHYSRTARRDHLAAEAFRKIEEAENRSRKTENLDARH